MDFKNLKAKTETEKAQEFRVVSINFSDVPLLGKRFKAFIEKFDNMQDESGNTITRKQLLFSVIENGLNAIDLQIAKK
jgi:hypothetical protein